MPIISRSCIEDIRSKVNIYDLVSPVVGLRKVGANYRGLSPFTNEKTPSFYVLPDKNIFKDFSSGEAGDIYKFVQLTERLNFQEAVESIAARFNIPVEYEKGKAPSGFKPSLRKEILDHAEDGNAGGRDDTFIITLEQGGGTGERKVSVPTRHFVEPGAVSRCWQREAYAREPFVLFEVRHHVVDAPVGHRNVARAIGASHFEGRIQYRHQRGQFCRRVEVGQAAAERAAVAGCDVSNVIKA